MSKHLQGQHARNAVSYGYQEALSGFQFFSEMFTILELLDAMIKNISSTSF